MKKRKIILEDGRYLIYYTFTKRRKRVVREKDNSTQPQSPNSKSEGTQCPS